MEKSYLLKQTRQYIFINMFIQQWVIHTSPRLPSVHEELRIWQSEEITQIPKVTVTLIVLDHFIIVLLRTEQVKYCADVKGPTLIAFTLEGAILL